MTTVTLRHVVDDVVRPVAGPVVRQPGHLQLVDGLGDLQVVLAGCEVGEGLRRCDVRLLRGCPSQSQRRAQADHRRELKIRRERGVKQYSM